MVFHTVHCQTNLMEGDLSVKEVVIDKEIEDGIGSERRKILEELIGSVKRWKQKEIAHLVMNHSKRCNKDTITLQNVIWDEPEKMTRFLLVVYRESFPSALIGEKNAEVLMEWITTQLMAPEKPKKEKVQYPPILKYRFINWLKKLSCEREKREIVKRVTNYVVDCMNSIVKCGFRSVPRRTESTVFVPINQLRVLENIAFADYQQKCQLTEVAQGKSSSNLKILPVGSSIRPIVVGERKTMERRRQNKVFLAALRFHTTRHGAASESIGSCRKKITDFSSASKQEIFYLKSDIRKFYPSIDQNELIKLLKEVVKGDCVVMTLECEKTLKGRKYRILRNRGGANWDEARAALDLSYKKDSPNYMHKKFTTTNVSRETLLKLLISSIRNTVKYRGKLYSVGRGISQGCVYSSLLGNLYLHERMRRITTMSPRESLLLRYADDFILLSHVRHVVETFHKQILQEDMGIRGNNQKTITNIRRKFYRVLHWCGMTFHTTRFALIMKRREEKVATA